MQRYSTHKHHYSEKHEGMLIAMQKTQALVDEPVKKIDWSKVHINTINIRRY